MTVESIGNLVQNVADHLFGQGSAVQAGTRIVGAPGAGSPAAPEDTFTLSTQNNSAQASAQEAGIFQLSPGVLTAPGAGIQATPATANVIQNSAQQAGPALDPSASQSQPSAAGTPNGGAPSAAIAQQGAAGPAASAQVQIEIQRLNASLPALGLTNNEIQQIDRIASLIKNFNPAAYADLVQQFEARSQTSAQQEPASAALGTGAIAGSGATTAGPGANGNGGSFQIQQIFAPPDGPAVNSAQNVPGNPNAIDANAAGQVALPGTSGQSPQVQPAHPAANSGTANPQAS
jgi:hypothetical protein